MQIRRVIRTELHFNPSELTSKQLLTRDPHVAMAWIQHKGPLPLFEDASKGDPAKQIGEYQVKEFLSATIQGRDLTPASWKSRQHYDVLPNLGAVDNVFYQEILIEQSPAEPISFVTLLKTAGPGVAIGTFAGVKAAGGLLLLVTVPAGIILVGTAIILTEVLSKLIPKLSGVAPSTTPLRAKKKKRSSKKRQRVRKA
jgi:hypothetical protein